MDRCHTTQEWLQWAKKGDSVMRFTHKAGEKMFVDFSGYKAHYQDPATGRIIAAEFFVSVLGASSCIFARAVADQTKESFADCNVRALEYYGGSPECIVPDNLLCGAPHNRLSRTILFGTPPKKVKALSWQSSRVSVSWRKTKRTNLWRLAERVMMKAYALLLLSLSGSYMRPAYPKSTWASSPGGVSMRTVTFALPWENSFLKYRLSVAGLLDYIRGGEFNSLKSVFDRVKFVDTAIAADVASASCQEGIPAWDVRDPVDKDVDLSEVLPLIGWEFRSFTTMEERRRLIGTAVDRCGMSPGKKGYWEEAKRLLVVYGKLVVYFDQTGQDVAQGIRTLASSVGSDGQKEATLFETVTSLPYGITRKQNQVRLIGDKS